MVLHVDLATLAAAADSELLQQVPRDLAAYYMALPLAREEGRVTVITAHPENRTAFQVLAQLLQSEIVAVTDSAASVASAIEQVYARIPTPRLVQSWTDDPLWCERVRATASLYAELLGLSVTHPLLLDSLASELPASLNPIDDRQPAVSLLVCHLGDMARVAQLVSHSPTSILLVGGDSPAANSAPLEPRRVLLALRGYGSDWAAVQQLRRLGQKTSLDITVMPLAGAASRTMGFTSPDHLDHCLENLGASAVTLRLRSGQAAEQLIAELQAEPYDLLVIATEGWGDFVMRTLDLARLAGAYSNQSTLVIRPPVRWNTTNYSH